MKDSTIYRGLVLLLILLGGLAAMVAGRSDLYVNPNQHGHEVIQLKEWTVKTDAADDDAAGDEVVGDDAADDGGSGAGWTAALPFDFPVAGENPEFSISHTLDEELTCPAAVSLMISLKYCDAEIYLDQDLIFANYAPENGYGRSEGVKYLIVELPRDWRGRTVTVRYLPLLGDAMRYGVSVPLLGEASEIIRLQIGRDALMLTLEFALIVIGVLLVGIHFLIHKKEWVGNSLWVLGVFSVNCGIYMMCQMTTVHLLADNSYLLYFLEFVMLPLIIVEITVLMMENVMGRLRKIYQYAAIAFLLVCAVQLALNFFSGLEFRRTLPMTHGMILILGCCMLVSVFRKNEMRAETRNTAFASLIPMVFGGIADLIMFYTRATDTPVYFFKIGLLIFILIQAYYSYIRYMRLYHEQVEVETYKKMAYQDGLTGLNNRLAYESDLKQMMEKKRALPACLSVDINNLKTVNDTLGHEAGDELILGMGAVLKQAAEGIGKVYRIGGDEFIVLLWKENLDMAAEEARSNPEGAAAGEIREQSPDILDLLKERLNVEKENYNRQRLYKLDFAVGSSEYQESDGLTLEKMIVRADQAMYEMKRRQKGHTGEQAVGKENMNFYAVRGDS